jgi:hypothetical protein
MKPKISLHLTILLTLSLFSSFSQMTFQSNSSIVVIKNSDTMDIPWAGGFESPQFSCVDLNLDGKEDLLVFDRSDLLVTPLINIGGINEIKYEFAPEYKNKFPKSSGWMLMRDYNNDGKKDIFYSLSGGSVGLERNTSNANLEFTSYLNYSSVQIYDPKALISYQFPNLIPIYIPNSDIPAIYDVNGDGDLDILSFGVLGTSIEYHKNYSVETYGNLDTCDFALKNECWGHFLEIGFNSNKLKLLDTCRFNVPNPERGKDTTRPNGRRPAGNGSRHSGSTTTAFDNNGDHIVDILLGDVSFNNVVMGQNGGTTPDQFSSITSQDTAFPSYDTSINLMLFPATFIEDVDNDGLKDLIVSPNIAEFSENYNQILFYKNEGTDTIPIFRYKQEKLFEKDVIDLGSKAIPELFDHNGDGLLDLIVSNYGYFNKDSISYECKISLYENIGTINNPVFNFITNDYQSIYGLRLGLSLHPTFGDIDGDGDKDLILGNSEGYLHLLTNTAGPGNTATFTLTTTRIQDDLGNVMDVGQFAAPQLFDYDNDGDLDLIVGKNNGKIRYYENTGTTSAYSFKKITDTLGRVEVNDPIFDPNGTQTGYSTPRFYRNGTSIELYCGGQRGGVFKYTGINPANPRQTFIIDTVLQNSLYGKYSVPFVHDFKNDGKLDMILGNNKGGLNLFTMKLGVLSIKNIELPVNFNLYPNPATESITISIENGLDKNQKLRIIDVSGKLVMESYINSTQAILDISKLKKGVYFVTLFTNKGQKTRKLVLQ